MSTIRWVVFDAIVMSHEKVKILAKAVERRSKSSIHHVTCDVYQIYSLRFSRNEARRVLLVVEVMAISFWVYKLISSLEWTEWNCGAVASLYHVWSLHYTRLKKKSCEIDRLSRIPMDLWPCWWNIGELNGKH